MHEITEVAFTQGGKHNNYDEVEDEKIEDKFVSKAVQYATSTSDLSGPFVKME